MLDQFRCYCSVRADQCRARLSEHAAGALAGIMNGALGRAWLCVFIFGLIAGGALVRAAAPSASTQPSPSPGPAALDARFAIGPILFQDDFARGTDQWTIELENGGKVSAGGGSLDIDVPAGGTVWFKPLLAGPVLIQYRATAISAGGVNDRVSDLNCFWMACDARHPGDLFGVHRSGKFADYNSLLTYYVGLGGNGNTTTRFRRYIGSPTTRPLLPQNDLRAPADLLTPNATQLIQLVADGSLVQFYRDGHRLFELNDADPYTWGWFAFRTTKSHLRIQSFSVRRLLPARRP